MSEDRRKSDRTSSNRATVTQDQVAGGLKAVN